MDGLTPFPDPADLSTMQVVFLTGMYGWVLFNAATILSDGSELLLLVPSIAPVIGSIVLPVLGAVPDGMMVLFSGMGDNAQEQISVGVGALAGSTIMLLTIPWSLSVLVGRVSIVNGEATYKRPQGAPEGWEKLDPKSRSLTGTGVGITAGLKDMAKMMMKTMLGYFIIQGACTYSEMNMPGEEGQQARAQSKFALVGLVFCTIAFFLYLKVSWQDSQGTIEDKVVELQADALRRGEITLRGAMAAFKSEGSDKFSNMDSEAGLNTVLLDKRCMDQVRHMVKLLGPFFKQYDANGDQTIDQEEFRSIFRDLNENNMTKDEMNELFKAADTDDDETINFEEFVACFMSFAMDPASNVEEGKEQPKAKTAIVEKDNDDAEESEEEQEDLPDDLKSFSREEQQSRIKKRAATKMIIGTLMVLVFSDPMVDLLSEIGKRVNISAFYISFVLAPLASNASELVASTNYARKRTQKGMNTALSALQGAAIMNNTFCLGIFLALMYFKQLAWEFTAETIAIILVQLLVCMVVMTRKSMSLLNGFMVLTFYPLSLLTVYVLENYVGLD